MLRQGIPFQKTKMSPHGLNYKNGADILQLIPYVKCLFHYRKHDPQNRYNDQQIQVEHYLGMLEAWNTGMTVVQLLWV
jgi:hypothetical protein